MSRLRIVYFRALTVVCVLFLFSTQAQAGKIRLGILAYGTVNWELDSVLHHGLASEQGVELEIVRLANKNASAIALQGGAVDAIVTDWIWVSRQRHAGADFSFVPHSVAVGELMVRPDSGIHSLRDLPGKKLGIAGGPVDKSWLMLRAYARQNADIDLLDVVEPSFAAPPLLNKIMLKGDIPAALNFWHYTARLRAAGMKQLLSVKEMLSGLGIESQPPIIGWVFSEQWASANHDTLIGFLGALRQAKKMLATSDTEWQRLRPLMKANDDKTFESLREAYRAGIPTSFSESDIAAARQLFSTLSKYGGGDLVGEHDTIAEGTFWPGFRY